MGITKRSLKRTLALTLAVILGVIATGLSSAGEMKVQASGRPVSIDTCLISGTDVVCQLSANSVPSGDDGKYYIYADEVYQDGPTGQIVATVKAGESATAVFPLNHNTPESNLSRKFLVAIKRDGQMMQVSDEHYITNPEAMEQKAQEQA